MKNTDYVNEWGETVVPDTSSYDPQLIFDAKMKAVVCSVCRRTPTAVNFLHTGVTKGTEEFVTPDGKRHNSRQVHGLTRTRRER